MALPTTVERADLTAACHALHQALAGDRFRFLDASGAYLGPPANIDPDRTLYVSKQGSDSNDGSDWDNAFLTIQAAMTASRAAFDWAVWPGYRPGAIYVAPGEYEEQLKSMPWQMYIVGVGDAYDRRGGNGSVIVKFSTGPVIGNLTAATGLLSVVFQNIVFQQDGAFAGAKLATMQSSGFENCVFYRGAGGTYGLHVGTAKTGPKDSWVKNCWFVNGSTPWTHGIYCDYSEADTYAFHNGLIAGNVIEASAAGIYIHGSAVATGCRIVGNLIYRPTKGIDDDNGNSWCVGNHISATSDAIEHANSPTQCIDNHVINNATGAKEASGT